MLLPTLVLDAPHARATLRVEVERAKAGRSFLAAVEVDTDPHWHVYWRNPGDSGIPTTVAWKVPKGWRVEPLEEPTPTRFAPGGVAAYGYEGKALFLARVTPSANSGTLAADVRWLVCANACVPGAASVSTKVAVGGSAKPGTEAVLLKRAQAALPRRAPLWSFTAVRIGAGIGCTFAPPGRPQDSAEFFPMESGLIDQSKRATATLQKGRYVFKMEPSPFPEPRSRLEGLIVLSDGTAWIVSKPLQRG